MPMTLLPSVTGRCRKCRDCITSSASMAKSSGVRVSGFSVVISHTAVARVSRPLATTQGGMEAGSSIFAAEESRKKQTAATCVPFAGASAFHLAPPDYMVTEAAIMGVARV